MRERSNPRPGRFRAPMTPRGLLLATRSRPGSRQDAFTVLEILVASAIMAIGLVMVFGLFPYGIKLGTQVVEDTTAVSVARSVADAIRFGLRNNLRYNNDREGTTFTYFVFQHDGVTDPVPRNVSLERPDHDYYILLPRHRPNAQFQTRTEAVQRSKFFVYPESDPDPSSSGVRANGGGNPFLADDDKDDYQPLDGGPSDIFVRKVYQLGSTFPSVDPDVAPPGPNVLEDQRLEVLKQYSYAFEIRQSLYDADMETARQFRPGNELYHVRIMVYRSFEENFTETVPVKPIFELEFEVSR